MAVQRELSELHRLAHDRDVRSETNITITFPFKAPVVFKVSWIYSFLSYKARPSLTLDRSVNNFLPRGSDVRNY